MNPTTHLPIILRAKHHVIVVSQVASPFLVLQPKESSHENVNLILRG